MNAVLEQLIGERDPMENVYVCYNVFGMSRRDGPYTWEQALREMQDISTYLGVSDCTFLIEGPQVKQNTIHIPTFAQRLDEPFI